MKKPRTFVDFKAKCYAMYSSRLELPEEFTDVEGNLLASEDDVLTYVRMHLPEANVNDLEWLSDLSDICDSVESEDIKAITTENAYSSTISFLEDLADAIKDDPRAKDCQIDIYGSFGLRACSSLYIRNNDGHIVGSLTVELLEEGIFYETGHQKQSDRYPEGSLGAINGFNNEIAKLPMDIDKIKDIVFSKNKEVKNEL